MLMHYIVFDPGKTTGFLLARRHKEEQLHTIVQSEEIVWAARFDFIYEVFQKYAHLQTTVIVEDFKLFDRGKVNRSNEMPSSQVIGIIQMAMYANNLDPLNVFFYPPNAKSEKCMLKSDLLRIKPGSAHCLDTYKLLVHHRFLCEQYTPPRHLCYNGSSTKSVTRKVRKEL